MAGRNGGARPGAGRKPKADEIALIEKMDAILAPDVVWEKLCQLVADGDQQAIKLWLSYRYGMPKQIIDTHLSGGLESYKPSWFTVEAITTTNGHQKES